MFFISQHLYTVCIPASTIHNVLKVFRFSYGGSFRTLLSFETYKLLKMLIFTYKRSYYRRAEAILLVSECCGCGFLVRGQSPGSSSGRLDKRSRVETG